MVASINPSAIRWDHRTSDPCGGKGAGVWPPHYGRVLMRCVGTCNRGAGLSPHGIGSALKCGSTSGAYGFQFFWYHHFNKTVSSFSNFGILIYSKWWYHLMFLVPPFDINGGTRWQPPRWGVLSWGSAPESAGGRFGDPASGSVGQRGVWPANARPWCPRPPGVPRGAGVGLTYALVLMPCTGMVAPSVAGPAAPAALAATLGISVL